jgi:protein-disulfide isomerase
VTKLRTALEMLAYLVVIASSCSVLWWIAVNAKSHEAIRVDDALPTAPIQIEGSPTLGASDAPVAVIVFSDFECPFCAQTARTVLQGIRNRFVAKGQVLLAYRNFPLAIHPHAVEAAEAAECAKAQGRFWEIHDVLFGVEWFKEAPRVNWERLGQVAGLRLDEFSKCRESRQYRQSVEADVAYGRSLNVHGTPTLFVTG